MERTRHETVARWVDALERADNENLTIRAGMFGTRDYVVSSSTGELSYATNGVYCGCAAAEHGDPVCKHRALALDTMGVFPEKLAEVEQIEAEREYWRAEADTSAAYMHAHGVTDGSGYGPAGQYRTYEAWQSAP